MWPIFFSQAEGNSGAGHSSHVTCVRFTANDQSLISVGGQDCSIMQWNLKWWRNWKTLLWLLCTGKSPDKETKNWWTLDSFMYQNLGWWFTDEKLNTVLISLHYVHVGIIYCNIYVIRKYDCTFAQKLNRK